MVVLQLAAFVHWLFYMISV